MLLFALRRQPSLALFCLFPFTACLLILLFLSIHENPFLDNIIDESGALTRFYVKAKVPKVEIPVEIPSYSFIPRSSSSSFACSHRNHSRYGSVNCVFRSVSVSNRSVVFYGTNFDKESVTAAATGFFARYFDWPHPESWSISFADSPAAADCHWIDAPVFFFYTPFHTVIWHKFHDAVLNLFFTIHSLHLVDPLEADLNRSLVLSSHFFPESAKQLHDVFALFSHSPILPEVDDTICFREAILGYSPDFDLNLNSPTPSILSAFDLFKRSFLKLLQVPPPISSSFSSSSLTIFHSQAEKGPRVYNLLPLLDWLHEWSLPYQVVSLQGSTLSDILSIVTHSSIILFPQGPLLFFSVFAQNGASVIIPHPVNAASYHSVLAKRLIEGSGSQLQMLPCELATNVTSHDLYPLPLQDEAHYSDANDWLIVVKESLKEALLKAFQSPLHRAKKLKFPAKK